MCNFAFFLCSVDYKSFFLPFHADYLLFSSSIILDILCSNKVRKPEWPLYPVKIKKNKKKKEFQRQAASGISLEASWYQGKFCCNSLGLFLMPHSCKKAVVPLVINSKGRKGEEGEQQPFLSFLILKNLLVDFRFIISLSRVTCLATTHYNEAW